MMEISLGELLGHIGKTKEPPTPFVVGKCYLIRTVTLYSLGRIKEVTGDFLVLSEASWIPDTGRFSDALRSGELEEIEPFVEDLIVNLGSVIDATEWAHKLPTEKK